MYRSRAIVIAFLVLVLPLAAFAQHSSMKKSTAVKTTDAQMIQNAMAAAPPEISKHATIMAWGKTMSDTPRELRKGTNGWVCFPNSPSEFGAASVDDPMCFDKQWQALGDALAAKKDPVITGTGIAYMLRGDRGASNTDPFAMGPTATNAWVVSPPHIMVLYADRSMLDAFPTDPKTGGPWVMWKGTPYAHLMVPVSTTKMVTMPSK